ncbi:hypothetical protein ACFL0A_02500 [Patescibacteria group bacterium]
MTKYTVPGTAEDIVFEMNTAFEDKSTVLADSIVILGIRLDADLVDGTDYKYAEDDDSGAPTQYTSTPADFATITFTPGNNGDDWLVIAASTHLVDGVADQTSHLIRYDASSLVPMWSAEGEDDNEEKSNLLMRVYNLDNTSHTFALQGSDVDQLNDHYRSAIIALRLNVFEEHYFNWNEAENTPGGTTYEELYGITPFTPQTGGDFVLMGYASCDSGDSDDSCGIRTQVNATTYPTGKDGNWDNSTNDNLGEVPMLTLAKVNLAASSQDIDFDGAVSENDTALIEDRSIVAFALEIATVNQTPTVSNVSLNAGGSISPTENTIVDVDVTGKVTDGDGWDTISNITALAYRSDLSASCVPGTSNDNNCYTGVTCNSSGSGTVADVTCAADIWFHADSTDSGGWSGYTWLGTILATDSADTTHQANSSGVEMIGSLCLDVAASIAYSLVPYGGTSGSVNQTTLVSNTCNTAMDVLVSGVDMTSAASSGTVTVEYQHYHTAAFTFDGGSDVTLTGSPTAAEIACAKPTSHGPTDSSDDIFWGIGVIQGTPTATDYGGVNTFTATND